jgi:hypothetical protein
MEELGHVNQTWRAKGAVLLKRLSWVALIVAVLFLLVAIIRPLAHGALARRSVAFMALAFLCSLWRIYLLREPIWVMFRPPITIQNNPIGYLLPFVGLSLCGLFLLFLGLADS